MGQRRHNTTVTRDTSSDTDQPKSRSSKADLRSAIRNRALDLGFDAVGFAAAQTTADTRQSLAAWLEAGYHGDMGWMADTAERRESPDQLWPEARTIVCLAMNYGPDEDPLALLDHDDRGIISVYARNRDYHDTMKKALKALGRWIAEEHGHSLKVFVDTAPVMEKPLAQAAGLGWQGKHTNLVSRQHGSWLFLGEVFLDVDLAPEGPETDHCGSCRRCLDVCPTNAFPYAYQIDARRCLSYLTIEHKEHIPEEFRVPMGNRIYGCDDCLAVCPWNKFAHRSEHATFSPRAELTAPRLADLASLDDATFRQIFRGSPIKRIGRDRFLRNVLIALGNSTDPRSAEAVRPHLGDPNPIVRAMAVWALSRLLPEGEMAKLHDRHAPGESDEAVLAEWSSALLKAS